MSRWQLREVIEWVDEFALSAYRQFYPSAPAKDLDIPVGEIFQKLLMLVKEDILELNYKVICPLCYEIVELSEMSTYAFCGNCDEEFEITADCYLPIFSVNDEYRSTLKLKKNEKSQYNYLLSSARQIRNHYHYTN